MDSRLRSRGAPRVNRRARLPSPLPSGAQGRWADPGRSRKATRAIAIVRDQSRDCRAPVGRRRTPRLREALHEEAELLPGRAGVATRRRVRPATTPRPIAGQRPPLLRRASNFAAVAIGDEIWAVGEDVQGFDGRRWSLGPALSTPRFGVAAAVLLPRGGPS